MPNPFFEHPILNSPYAPPSQHWELDKDGQPTQKIVEARRRAEFITPIPKPKKRRRIAAQETLVFDEGKGLSTKEQQYDPTSIINEVRGYVDVWRTLPNSSQWQVTPETARLLQHWRSHKFGGVRPFFCQVEAAETAIWITEVAPQSTSGKRLLAHPAAANKDANPELMRFALKLATGAGKTTVMAMLYDDNKKVRVAGPFTVESLSPHRMLGVDENDELIDNLKENSGEYAAKQSFPQMILENLKIAGVQQAHKEDRITFTALALWPGDLVCAEGHYMEGEIEKRAAIFIGPEFGTVQRADLVAAAREAGDAAFDVLIACAFNYEAHTTEFSKLGRLPVLKARMNADLHMSEDLKNTGKGNLFVIFGEPDITLLPEPDGRMRVKVNGVDVFKPQTGEVISDGADGIACWFIDTDYNEESFFVRHAYFLGANNPYSALKTTLKAEINPEAWATLNSDTSRPFDKPTNGRIAVKVINHLGDEVMKVFRVDSVRNGAA